jgi:integrase
MRKLPSGRWQAFYTGSDTALHYALSTFETQGDAEAWLTDERRLIAADAWIAPKLRRAIAEAEKPRSFGEYSATWLKNRLSSKGQELKPRTTAHYRSILSKQLAPFNSVPIASISAELVSEWHADLGNGTPTLRAHSYGLLKAILNTAVLDGLLAANPVHIRGAGASPRVHKVKPLSLGELEKLVAAMPERLRPMTLLAAWCALRFGELVELRRKDVDLRKDADIESGVIHVRRGAVRVHGEVIIGVPKSEAGIRDVSIPPHLIPALRQHLSKSITGGKNGLLFPAAHGGTLAVSTLQKSFYPAREAAGRPDLHWHDLRHTGATLAAQNGATLAELMSRLGHSTPQAAMIYQHATQERDAEIAKRMSEMVKP